MITYKPRQERIGPDVGRKDDGSDVEYQPKIEKLGKNTFLFNKKNWKWVLIIFLSLLITGILLTNSTGPASELAAILVFFGSGFLFRELILNKEEKKKDSY